MAHEVLFIHRFSSLLVVCVMFTWVCIGFCLESFPGQEVRQGAFSAGCGKSAKCGEKRDRSAIIYKGIVSPIQFALRIAIIPAVYKADLPLFANIISYFSIFVGFFLLFMICVVSYFIRFIRFYLFK